MENISTMISTLGFPIVAVVALAWFIYVVWNKTSEKTEKIVEQIVTQSKQREDKLYDQIDKFGDTLNNFNATLASIDTRLDLIERQLNNTHSSTEKNNK